MLLGQAAGRNVGLCFSTESATLRPPELHQGRTMQVDFMKSEPKTRSGAAPRVCVIGAGISGLVSIRALAERGLDVTAYDMSDRVGGLWVFDNPNGRGGAYRSLRINTSALAMAFSDFPWPSGTPDYPRHDEVARYFDAYAEHFALRRFIRFGTEVERCVPTADGYEVTTRALDSGERRTETFDAVIVANGHHFRPAFPNPPARGSFDGITLHSHHYVDPTTPHDLRGKRVVVVGFGNSAVDIASELAARGDAARVILSVRRGSWVIPKYIRGKPADQGELIPTWLPEKLRRRLVTLGFRFLFGKMSDFGLPEPDHLIGEAHPTLSDELPALVKSGRVVVRPAIDSLEGKSVVFGDGSREEIDAIVYCTGYHVDFPFFERTHLSAPDNRLPLFRRVFHPEHHRVFFIGLAQPLGGILPIAELQARVVAAHLSGDYNLPNADVIAAELDREERNARARYVSSPRHTMQIDPKKYRAELTRELERGRLRARARAGRPFSSSAPPLLSKDPS